MGVDRSLAENQRRFRLANEQIDRARVELGFDGGAVPFLCECPDRSCTEVLPLTPEEYAQARADDERYILLPAHVPDEEDVIERNERWVLTRKVVDA